jgi:hypothetical protein
MAALILGDQLYLGGYEQNYININAIFDLSTLYYRILSIFDSILLQDYWCNSHCAWSILSSMG